LAALLALLLVLGFAVKLWRRWLPYVARAESRPRVVYRAELDRLSDLSQRRRFGETREAFARRMAAVAPSLAPLTAAHVAGRYGRTAPHDPSAIAHDLQRELRRSFPWWRRALGALHPWAWLRTR